MSQDPAPALPCPKLSFENILTFLSRDGNDKRVVGAFQLFNGYWLLIFYIYV